MAGQVINQYAIERNTIGDLDYFDLDWNDGGVFKTAKIKGSVFKGINGGLFAQTEDGPVLQNSTTESSILGNGAGTLLIPSNTWVEGQSYTLLATGTITAVLNDQISFTLKSSSADFVAPGAMTMFQITPANFWRLEMIMTCRSIGGVGVAELEASGTFQCKVDTGAQYKTYPIEFNNSTTFDTTIDNTLDLTGEWSVANANNRLTTRTVNFKRTF